MQRAHSFSRLFVTRESTWWRHQMEHFRVTGFCAGIHRSPVNSPHKGQWPGTLMFSLICAWRNSWVNNREAGDLRRFRTHYDVTVMIYICLILWFRRIFGYVFVCFYTDIQYLFIQLINCETVSMDVLPCHEVHACLISYNENMNLVNKIVF